MKNNIRVMESPLASRPGLLLSVVPTFLRWPREKKLEGEELYDASLVAFYFQQEIQRNSRQVEQLIRVKGETHSKIRITTRVYNYWYLNQHF